MERPNPLAEIEKALDKAIRKSLRTEFAKFALQGMLASEKWECHTAETVAKVAVSYADAMIEELK